VNDSIPSHSQCVAVTNAASGIKSELNTVYVEAGIVEKEVRASTSGQSLRSVLRNVRIKVEDDDASNDVVAVVSHSPSPQESSMQVISFYLS
jgi:hypothetical protein